MKAEIDIIGEKQPFLTNKPFLNEVKVKFLQIKQENKCQKHEIDSVSAYEHMRRDTSLINVCTQTNFG